VKTGLGTLLETAGISTDGRAHDQWRRCFRSQHGSAISTTASITLNGGVLSLFQPTNAANLAVTATTLTMNAGGYLKLQDGTTNLTVLNLTNLNRANRGVLLVNALNGRLGTAPDGNGEQLIAGTIFGVPAATASNNGILGSVCSLHRQQRRGRLCDRQ
jgi:hypothetical protein